MNCIQLGRAAVLGFGISVIGWVQPAHAYVIDFTNLTNWAAADGTSIYTLPTLFDGVQVSITSQGSSSRLSFNSGADVNPTCAAITRLACNGDGLGIIDDEVSFGSSLLDPNLERLYVHFSAPVSVNGIGFLDLFARNYFTGDAAAETAQWTVTHWSTSVIDTGSLVGTDSTSRLGYAATATSYTDVRTLMFFATPPKSSDNTDFALASLNITRVPEPGTLLLLALGMVAASSGRRHRS